LLPVREMKSLAAAAALGFALLANGCFAEGADEAVGESGAAQTRSGSSARGRTFRVENAFSPHALVAVMVAPRNAPSRERNTLRAQVAPRATGTFSIPDTSDFDGCSVRLLFRYANGAIAANQSFFGCTSTQTIEAPYGSSRGETESRWQPSSGGDSKSGASSGSKGGDDTDDGDDTSDDEPPPGK
jgi:hypothetical protein